ncbi:MAG: AAA family ATPase [Vulcanimicrobiaceae bacterium]
MSATATELAQRVRTGLEVVIAGNRMAIDASLIALLGDGHLLVEGVPGTAKTLLVRLLAALVGASFRRIQFTPDLMPSDVVGTTIFHSQTDEFAFRPGPIFASIVLADEINRTPPKTQAALLEAMEERQVTIDGVRHPLPAPFLVCATQNPVEFEGTYPLPEAQLDRFFVRARTEYPAAAEERALVARAAAGFDARTVVELEVTPVARPDEIVAAQRAVRAIFVAEPVQAYLYAIAARTRDSGDIALGASPRATLALLTAAQATAAIDGREFVTPDDVKTAAPLVLAHRLTIRPEAEVDGVTADAAVRRILDSVEVPKETAHSPQA